MSASRSPIDLAVVGGGAVGLAAAWRASAAGLRAVVVERAALFHGAGGSGGAERQWRLQYSDVESARLVVEAQESWRRLELAIDRPLIHRTGSLWYGDVEHETNEGQIRAAVSVLDALGLPYEWLDAPTIEKRFGFRRLDPTYQGFLQPDGGVLDVRATLWALYTLARGGGVEVRENTVVHAVEPDGDGVRVVTDHGTIAARHCVVTAGAHTSALLAPLGVHAGTKMFEMPSAYFRVRDDAVDYPTWFAFERPTDEDPGLYYGFGRNPWAARGLVRVAPDSEAHLLATANDATGQVRPEEMRRLSAWVARHLPDLDPTPIEPSTCLVTLPDGHDRTFHLGRVPGAEQIVYCASGWIFKFVPLLGEVCASLVRHGEPPAGLAPLLRQA